MKLIKLQSIFHLILLTGILFGFSLSASQLPVTLTNTNTQKDQTMYLLATESTSMPGQPYTNPSVSSFLKNAFKGRGGAKYDRTTQIVTLPPKSSFTFVLDTNEASAISGQTGLIGGRIYASNNISGLPSAPTYIPTISGNPYHIGFMELSYNGQTGGQCIDLSNVDSFSSVRFEAKMTNTDGTNVVLSYYDTYLNIYHKLLKECVNQKANPSISPIDAADTSRILSPVTDYQAWLGNLSQQDIITYFQTTYQQTQPVAANMVYTGAGGAYSLNYNCAWDSTDGSVVCTNNGSTPSQGWTGGTAPNKIKLYVSNPPNPAKKVGVGGQLTPTAVFLNTAPSSTSWFYAYDETLGNIGDPSDVPGSTPDMACNFVSQILLAGFSNYWNNIANSPGYSNVINNNSAAYSAPNSDTGASVVLQNLNNCNNLIINLIQDNYKYTGPKPQPPSNGGGLPQGTLDPQIGSTGVYPNNGNNYVAITFNSVNNGNITMNYPQVPVSTQPGAAPIVMQPGYNYTLWSNPYNSTGAASSNGTSDSSNVTTAITALPLEETGNTSYTINYNGKTFILTIAPGVPPGVTPPQVSVSQYGSLINKSLNANSNQNPDGSYNYNIYLSLQNL